MSPGRATQLPNPQRSPSPQPVAEPAVVAQSAGAAGTVEVVDASGRRTLSATQGTRLFIGGDPTATIRIVDPLVGQRYAIVDREGPGWLVTSLDLANPIWLLDETGRPHPVMEPLGLRSGTLLAGATQLLLHPPTP